MPDMNGYEVTRQLRAKPQKPGPIIVMLTGMGSDGAQGMLAMRTAGARTLGQSKETCVVYGMPRAAVALDRIQRRPHFYQLTNRKQKQ
jgi:chemotaxis response regulator CheB